MSPDCGAENPDQNGSVDKSGVRFAEEVQQLRPEPSELGGPKDVKEAQRQAELEEMTPEAREEIRRLAMSHQKSKLQEQRAGHFAYDTFSLPASRVCRSFSCSNKLLQRVQY